MKESRSVPLSVIHHLTRGHWEVDSELWSGFCVVGWCHHLVSTITLQETGNRNTRHRNIQYKPKLWGEYSQVTPWHGDNKTHIKLNKNLLQIIISKTLHRAKKIIRLKEVHILWSHLYGTLEKANWICTNSTSVVAWAWIYWLRKSTRELLKWWNCSISWLWW